MAKVKLTKTELKAQKEALARFQRFLPMLQLKKQQLQMEIAGIKAKAEEAVAQRDKVLADVSSWIGLFSTDSVELPVVFDGIIEKTGNIAGVTIPLYAGLKTHRPEIDLFSTPAWIDEAADIAANLMEFNAQVEIYSKQLELISEELRTTSQRVNLFEKVKIPECKENIRIIGIALGDEQTSAVARGKIAKGRGKNEAAMLAENLPEAIVTEEEWV